MRMPIGFRAHVDQLIEDARADIPAILQVRQAFVAELLVDVVNFVNQAGPDHLDARLRLLAVLELAQSIRENPCSDSSLPGSQP